MFKWAVTTYVYSMISFKYIKKVPKGFKLMKDDEIQEDFEGNVNSAETVADSVQEEGLDKKAPVDNALEV